MIKGTINFILFILVILGTGFIEGDRFILGCCLGFGGSLSLFAFNILTYEE